MPDQIYQARSRASPRGNFKMDPTLLAAVAGVLGVIIGAIIGGVFALKAAKRQVEVMILRRVEVTSLPLPVLTSSLNLRIQWRR